MLDILIKHIEEVVSLTPEEAEFIVNHFKLKRYKKHQFIIQEGDKAIYHYFIISGLTKLVYLDQSGKEHIVSFAMEDWWESDFYAFYTGTPATLSLICLEDTTVLALNNADYFKLCQESPTMQRFFLEKANFGYLGMQRRVLSSLTLNAAQRYEQFLKQYPKLSNRIPKSQLAAYLGVSRETLSRLNL
ncbi:Crp/Fnr family transcriptional regulator [Sphingobacterium thalpophilum]|uniref:Crp/Fnr family transcriptional regulator n=1 Tax=Sphingobacterium thalpophilum TaxID=259 RepID=A0A4U9VLR8_9SPHI|nr:Crp/Fnr family transcriptional regulator [Sphingobacterium thalpophilum]VTR48135.1 cAMP regulatory protein [Sphingobacterium thalpophilum]